VRFSKRGALSFLRFQGSRAGLFNDLSARETCPLHRSPEREPGLPPQISHEKTAPSRQSLRKDTAPLFKFDVRAVSAFVHFSSPRFSVETVEGSRDSFLENGNVLIIDCSFIETKSKLTAEVEK
jgi:hypothetical protein